MVSYPVRYEITFPDRILVNKLPGRLKFSLKGDGYTLMQYILKPKIHPIELNIQSYPLRPVRGAQPGQYYLLTSYIRGAVSDQLPQELSLIGISPDTLVFVFDSIVDKKVPVIPDVDLELSRQVMLKTPIKVIPDSVSVSGPGRIMDTLKKIPTVAAQFSAVEKSFEKELSLVHIPGLKIIPRKVKLIVDVEQFTEASLEIPIVTKNVPDTLVLKTFPSRVNVLFHVVLSKYNQTGPAEFEAVVDYNHIVDARSGKIRVELLRRPEYVDAVRIAPERVDYLIEKKQ